MRRVYQVKITKNQKRANANLNTQNHAVQRKEKHARIVVQKRNLRRKVKNRTDERDERTN